MQVTVKRGVVVELTLEEAAVLYRILGSVYADNGPAEVTAVVNRLYDVLDDMDGVALTADDYIFTGQIDFEEFEGADD